MTKLSGRKSFDKHRTVSPPRPAGKPSPRYKCQACGSEGSTATRPIPKCRSDVNAALNPVALAKPVRFERSHWRDGICQSDQLFACGKRAPMAWRHPPHSAHQLSMAALGYVDCRYRKRRIDSRRRELHSSKPIHQLRERVSGARQILHRAKIVKGQALATMHTDGGNPNRWISNLRAPGLTAAREVDADEASILG